MLSQSTMNMHTVSTASDHQMHANAYLAIVVVNTTHPSWFTTAVISTLIAAFATMQLPPHQICVVNVTPTKSTKFVN